VQKCGSRVQEVLEQLASSHGCSGARGLVLMIDAGAKPQQRASTAPSSSGGSTSSTGYMLLLLPAYLLYFCFCFCLLPFRLSFLLDRLRFHFLSPFLSSCIPCFFPTCLFLLFFCICLLSLNNLFFILFLYFLHISFRQ